MAIMATLVVYCLKSIPETAWQDNLILLAGVAVTGIVHLWKKSSILSITVVTVLYMVLVHLALFTDGMFYGRCTGFSVRTEQGYVTKER